MAKSVQTNFTHLLPSEFFYNNI